MEMGIFKDDRYHAPWMNKCKHCRILLSISINKFLINSANRFHSIESFDVAFIQIISQLFIYFLWYKDSGQYWISDRFICENTKSAIISFISKSIMSIQKAIRDPNIKHSPRNSAAC